MTDNKTLEGWIEYHTGACTCTGEYQCPGCTIKELDESWKRTYNALKEDYYIIKRQHGALLNAIKHNST